MSIDIISRFFKKKSVSDPSVSESINTDNDLKNLPNGSLVKHLVGNEFIKVGSNVFDKVEDNYISKYELPRILALGHTGRLYMVMTLGPYISGNSYSASQIHRQGIISGYIDVTGSYYCIGSVDLNVGLSTGGCGCGCGCGGGCGGGGTYTEGRCLNLFVRYS